MHANLPSEHLTMSLKSIEIKMAAICISVQRSILDTVIYCTCNLNFINHDHNYGNQVVWSDLLTCMEHCKYKAKAIADLHIVIGLQLPDAMFLLLFQF